MTTAESVTGPDDQIAFPVAGHGPVGDLGGPFGDQDHPGDPLTGVGLGGHSADGPRPLRRHRASSRRSSPRPCTNSDL